MRILLDTSAYTAFKRNHSEVVDLVRSSKQVVFSPIVAGELLAGFRHGTRFGLNFRELKEFLAHFRVRLAPVTLDTADRYGRIYAALRHRGKPIPSNDMWVAAQAMETGAELVTFDSHFNSVTGLALISI